MCVWFAVFSLFQSVPATDVETLLTMNWDPNVALSITSELVVMEVINRIFICIFEVSVTLQVAPTSMVTNSDDTCGCSRLN